MRETDYGYLVKSAEALIKGVPHLTANLANVSALIFSELEDINWAGFYLSEGDRLVLGPFQGRPAVSRIPLGRGVCGTAAAERSTQLVQDVHACENHIACDLNSRSEIVVPLERDGRLFGVLDIDSPVKARFDEEDRQGLEQAGEILSRWLREKEE